MIVIIVNNLKVDSFHYVEVSIFLVNPQLFLENPQYYLRFFIRFFFFTTVMNFCEVDSCSSKLQVQTIHRSNAGTKMVMT